MAELTGKKAKEAKTVERFIEVYCEHHHADNIPAGEALCDCCRDLRDYALARLTRCPFDPKPKCKDCTVHCYRGDYRDRIREVMKFSGMHFAKRGRVDWLFRYMLG